MFSPAHIIFDFLATALSPIFAIGGLAGGLALILAVLHRALHVSEDPRIKNVEAMLPHTNCGACGFPGCRAFAEALVTGESAPAACTVGSGADHKRIAAYLKVAPGEFQRRVARLACGGGANVARFQAHYSGPKNCRVAMQAGGGGKACAWGCLGFGDCERACERASFQAIDMNAESLPVVDPELCTACGDCVTACPLELFSLQSREHRLWVACKNTEAGDAVLADCAVGCTACEKCAVDALPGLITMQANLPRIDYSRNELSKRAAIERCPTGAIVWWLSDSESVPGRESPRLSRRRPLPVARI